MTFKRTAGGNGANDNASNANTNTNTNQQDNQQNNGGGAAGGNTGFFSLNDSLGTSLSFLGGSASLNALNDFFIKEIFDKKPGSKDVYRVVTMDRSTTGVPLSLFVLSACASVAGTMYLPTAVLILSDQSVQLSSRSYHVPVMGQIQGRTVDVPSVPGDIVNAEMLAAVKEQVLAAWGHPSNGMVLKAGFSVLPADFNIEDKAKVGQVVLELSSNIDNVVSMRLQDTTKTFSLLNNVQKIGAQVYSRTNFNSPALFSRTGQPIRADFVNTVSLGKQNNSLNGLSNQQQVSTVDSQRELVSVSAFVDYNYYMQNQHPQNMMPGQVMPMQTQCLAPRIVATALSSGVYRVTPETAFLGLVSLTPLADNYSWAYVARRRSSVMPMKDIGAFGFLVPALVQGSNGKPTRIKTDGADFGNAQMIQLIRSVVNPNPWFSIDLEEAGQNSAINELFANIAKKDPEAMKIARFYLNQLTGGKFDEVLAARNVVLNDILVNDGNRIQLGHYTDLNKNIADIRDVDTVAVLNKYGLEDPRMFQNWVLANSNKQMHDAERLHIKWNVISDLTGMSAVLTGYAQRYTLHPLFLDLLRDAIQRTNLYIQPSNMSFFEGGNAGMTYDQIQQFAFGGGQGANPFGFGQQNNAFQGGGFGMGGFGTGQMFTM